MVFGNPNEWAGGGSVGLRRFSWRRANLLRFAPASSPHPYLLPVSAKPLTAAAPAGDAMTPEERRAGASLASIFALRMLGLFLILPVFAVYAHTLPSGDNGLLVGLAIGQLAAHGDDLGQLQVAVLPHVAGHFHAFHRSDGIKQALIGAHISSAQYE